MRVRYRLSLENKIVTTAYYNNVFFKYQVKAFLFRIYILCSLLIVTIKVLALWWFKNKELKRWYAALMITGQYEVEDLKVRLASSLRANRPNLFTQIRVIFKRIKWHERNLLEESITMIHKDTEISDVLQFLDFTCDEKVGDNGSRYARITYFLTKR
jgi:hypothetical protein